MEANILHMEGSMANVPFWHLTLTYNNDLSLCRCLYAFPLECKLCENRNNFIYNYIYMIYKEIYILYFNIPSIIPYT